MKTEPFAALRTAFAHPARTAIAATLSLIAARLLGMPEAFWAPISTIIIVQSNLDVALTVSWQRLVGTALGCVSGALLVTGFGPGVTAYGAGVFGVGLLCTALRLDKAAYRFAGITLTIVMWAVSTEPAWRVALHRFCEVSLGIMIGVIMVALWPQEERTVPL